MEKILVIEDDRAIRKVLKQLFEGEGYLVEFALDGVAGLEAFRTTHPELIILDLNLPHMTGRDLCKEIRKESPAAPIIVLTAVDNEVDRILLLELGADDYVTKPFSPRELLARAHAVLRRSKRLSDEGGEDTYRFAEVTVDFLKMEIVRCGRPVSLTRQEFKLLKYFAQHHDRVISREELLNEVWGYNNYPTTRTVDAHIMTLRQKLEQDPAVPVHFLTVHGVGYKFIT